LGKNWLLISLKFLIGLLDGLLQLFAMPFGIYSKN